MHLEVWHIAVELGGLVPMNNKNCFKWKIVQNQKYQKVSKKLLPLI